MKRYVRSNDDEYISFDGWCNSFKGRSAFDKFCNDLERKVRQTFDIAQYRMVRFQGYYRIEIYLNDGKYYEFKFDGLYLHGSLFEYGVNLSVDDYFNKIKDGIK